MEAVPIVMQCPGERAMPASAAAQSAAAAGRPAGGLGEPPDVGARAERLPTPSPSSIGLAVTITAGRSTLAAPISRPGTVLSHPPSSTTASTGLARSSSSVSIASWLR